MCSRIKLSSIPSALRTKVRQLLMFQPIVSKQFALNSVFRYNQAEKEPVFMYWVEDESQSDPTLRLPYYFATKLMNGNQNTELKHSAVEFKFTGKLKSAQELVVDECMKHLKEHGTTIIGTPPGSGKTIKGAFLAAKLGLLTLVIYPRSALGTQWKKTFTDHTTAKTWIVGEESPEEANVVLCLDTRVNKLPQEYRNMIGTVILDEAHMLCTPSHVSSLLSCSPRYIIAETATLERTDGMHIMIQAMCGTHGVFPKVEETDEGYKMNILGQHFDTKQFRVVKVETSIKPERKQNKQGTTDWSVLQKSLLYNEQRNKLVLDIIKSHGQAKIIILTSQKDHVKYLSGLLEEMKEKVDTYSGTKKSYKNCRILIGTISKIGTGFDEANSCPDFDGQKTDILILLSSMKQVKLLEQNVGRIRSDQPLIYHFVDDDNIIRRHWGIAKKWYSSMGATLTDYNKICKAQQGK